MKQFYHNIINKIIIISVMVLCSPTLHAQLFPIQVNPQMIPPYSLKISEYGTAQSERLVVNLLSIDVTDSSRRVTLKLYIESNEGFSAQSNDVVVGANPIILDGGIPVRLTNIDLQAYFSLQNLRGISPQQYNRTLPEGLYRFCFEVFDARTGQQLSRKSCATAYLVLNDPPFLNLPNRGELIAQKEPQNIIFQWTPRHLNATNVQYEFTLAELWDSQMNPQAAFLASRPLFQTTTFSNTLLYGPAESPLLPDKNYAWRVRAVITDGISETSVFRNDGYSEIYHFTYTGACDAPGYLLAEAMNPTTQKILWQGAAHKQYKIQYRKKGSTDQSENFVWFEKNAFTEQKIIYNLEPGTTYEYRVGGMCKENTGYTYSQINEFTTNIAASDATTYNCGITPEIVITNQDPLQVLVINDVFTAGDFPVTVKEVDLSSTLQDGIYNGWGYIVVPYLQDTRIKVSFNGIKINSDYQLIDGIVITDYDENWGGVVDVGQELINIQDLLGKIEELWQNLIDNYADIRNNGTQYTEDQWQSSTNDFTQTSEVSTALIDKFEEAGVVDAETADRLREGIQESKEDWDSMTECYQSNTETEEETDPDKGGVAEDCNTHANNSEADFNAAELKKVREYTQERDDKIYRALIALQALGAKGFMKCVQCDSQNEEVTTVQELDGSAVFRLESKKFKSTSYIKCIMGMYDKSNSETPLQFDKFNKDTTVDANVKTSLENVYTSFNAKLESNGKVLAILSNTEDNVILCNTSLSIRNFCNNSDIVSEEEKEDLAKELSNCLESTPGEVKALEEITNLLQSATKQIRSNQRMSFEQDNLIYELNAQGIAQVNTDALTADQINKGDWQDGNVDNMMRLSINDQGNLQFSALGLYGKISNEEGKDLDPIKIADEIRKQTNKVFNEYKIKKPETTLNDIGANFNTVGGAFPDGRDIEINKESGFMKLVSEGLGVATTFAKTTLIEEAVYVSYDTNDPDQVIKAPPVLTGATEAGGKKVTELTSMVAMVYDITFDKEVRKQTVDGFIAIKDQIKDDPISLFPLLKEAIIEEATGSNSEDLENIDIRTAKGQHTTSKASVSVVVTVIAGTKFLLELPEIAAKIATKLSKADLLKLIKEGSEQLTKKIDELGELKGKFLEDLASMKDDIAKFIENPRLVDAWKKLHDLGLDEAFRKNPLYIEITKKLDDLKFHTNPIEADKLIKNINEGINQIGDNGKIILNKIKSGEFESISGYKDLIRGIKKVPDNAINSNIANEVAQTFRHLDNTSSVPNSRKVLGHKSITDPKFDIDYAEKATNGSKLYDKAYQFKTTNDATSVHNRLKLENLNKQLKNADANERILQIEIRNGLTTDVESGKYFNQRLTRAKEEITGFKLIITDANGSILKTY